MLAVRVLEGNSSKGESPFLTFEFRKEVIHKAYDNHLPKRTTTNGKDKKVTMVTRKNCLFFNKSYDK